MLSRLFFVAGMTVGVMAPLVWAAYVSVPAFRTVPERAGDSDQSNVVGIALHETPKPQSVSRSTLTTSSIDAAAAVSGSLQPKSDLQSVTTGGSPSLEPEPEQLTKPILPRAHDRKAKQAPLSSEEAKPTPAENVTSTVSIAPALEQTLQAKRPQDVPNEKKRAKSTRASPRKMTGRAPPRDDPEVVDLYGGPHIIVVCSGLTGTQKRRMGCP
jgi:hypothetical protein